MTAAIVEGEARVVEAMSPSCHGEERSDVAIQLESRWIATPSFLELAMTMESMKSAG